MGFYSYLTRVPCASPSPLGTKPPRRLLLLLLQLPPPIRYSPTPATPGPGALPALTPTHHADRTTRAAPRPALPNAEPFPPVHPPPPRSPLPCSSAGYENGVAPVCTHPPPCGGLRSSLKRSRPGGNGQPGNAATGSCASSAPAGARSGAARAAAPAEHSRPLSGEPGPAGGAAGGPGRKGLWGGKGSLMGTARLTYRGAFLRATCVFKPQLFNSRKPRQACS